MRGEISLTEGGRKTKHHVGAREGLLFVRKKVLVYSRILSVEDQHGNAV